VEDGRKRSKEVRSKDRTVRIREIGRELLEFGNGDHVFNVSGSGFEARLTAGSVFQLTDPGRTKMPGQKNLKAKDEN